MKKISIMLGLIILIILIICLICYFNNDSKMAYKFENDKLYITTNNKDWKEVPFDVSFTINHLNETNNGKYREGTYQLNNNKIVFYYEHYMKGEIMDTDGNMVPIAGYKYETILIYSDDKGKNWKETVVGTGDELDVLQSVKFKNKNDGEMILKGRDNIMNYFYKTSDGGKNWEEISSSNTIN